MPIKFVLPDLPREQEDGKNNFWKFLKESTDFIEIVDNKNWDTDAEDFDVADISAMVDSFCFHLRQKFQKDYRNEKDLNQLPQNVEKPYKKVSDSIKKNVIDVNLDEIYNLEINEGEWWKILTSYLTNILKVIKSQGIDVSYNAATRLLAVALRSLNVKYIDPSENLIAYHYYSNLVKERVLTNSEWLDKYPVKLFQNLASSDNGIIRFRTQSPKGLKLVAYGFDDQTFSRAMSDLREIGVSDQIYEFIENKLRQSVDIAGEKIQEVSDYFDRKYESETGLDL